MVTDARAQGTHAAPPPATPTPISLTAAEPWGEPWIWRPSDWPGQRFTPNVIENENPGVIVGFGKPSAVLFSYNGGTPGPTIRMRGDEVLLVILRNLLGQDNGTTPFGPYPDMAGIPSYLTLDQVNYDLIGEGRGLTHRVRRRGDRDLSPARPGCRLAAGAAVRGHQPGHGSEIPRFRAG